MGYLNTTIDFYDDNGGLLLQTVPDLSSLPDMVKAASVVDQSLDSDLYALVMQDGNDILKKYPTVDGGNTWLSSLYFAETHNKLPEEAQKVAAANLKEACEAFDIPVIDVIEKLASGDRSAYIVDVTGKDAPHIAAQNSGENMYAIDLENGEGIYPLNSAQDVQAADKYFSMSYGSFTPRERREYSVKVAHVADKYGINVSDSITMYSGESNQYSQNVVDHLEARRHLLLEEGDEESLFTLEKLSSIRETLDPEHFAHVLERFDKGTNLKRYWDRDLADPYYAVFNMEKSAAGMVSAPATIQVGSDTVTEGALKNFARDRNALVKLFGESFADSYQKDPLKIFQSMPLPQKKVIARMAEDSIGNM
tara:strand:+ start:3157 stop:4251 length:1095 start_codon:yes stop_codon:yes gene_type:complete